MNSDAESDKLSKRYDDLKISDFGSFCYIIVIFRKTAENIFLKIQKHMYCWKYIFDIGKNAYSKIERTLEIAPESYIVMKIDLFFLNKKAHQNHDFSGLFRDLARAVRPK